MEKTRINYLTKRLILLVLSVWCGAASASADDLVILKGTSAKVDVAEGIRKIDIGNPSVIDARPSEDGLAVMINALAEGNCELRIEKLQGADLITNVVVRSDLNELLGEVKDLLSDVEGLDIKVVGDKIVLEGNILTSSDNEKVNKVVGVYGNVILNMSTFDRSGMNKYVEEAILKDIGVPTITAHVTGDTVVLEGTVYNADDAKRAVELAKLRVPNVENMIQVQEVMVETDVQFVELSNDKNSDMGYNVLDSLGVTMNGSGQGVSTAASFPLTYGVSATASAAIKALLGNGSGKIVAQPHLTTKSGETGSFQSGGTTYFAVPSTVGPSTLQSVDYGVILTVKPTLEGENRILNEVGIEVSVPVGTGGGVLALQKYDTKCTALCNIGQSMVLSGMVQQISNDSKTKTPVLGDIPLLDLFFSNRTTDKSKDDFVILVTPQPVFPTAASGEPFGEQHAQLLEEQGGKE